MAKETTADLIVMPRAKIPKFNVLIKRHAPRIDGEGPLGGHVRLPHLRLLGRSGAVRAVQQMDDADSNRFSRASPVSDATHRPTGGAGQHRAPSIPDLLIAATAEIRGRSVLHVDKDFELVADLTRQPLERLAT